ncbi:hypothetical protein D3C87_1219370 [compost metagenome]
MIDIKKDFQSFHDESDLEVAPMRALSKLKAQIEKEQAKPFPVATKLGVIHILSSVLSLAACPQFGVKLFGESEGLMHVFMQISPTFCQAFCGAFYLAVTFVMARLILTPEEWYLLLRTRTLTIATLALVSLGAFYIMDPQMTLEAGALWVFGATVAAELISHKRLPLKSLFH